MIPAVRILAEGMDITAGLIPAPFGVPLSGGGVAVPGGLNAGGKTPLMSITVTDQEGTKSDAVELELANGQRHKAPKKGSKFQVYLGYVQPGPLYMGAFKSDGWTKTGGPRRMTVSAKSADFTADIKAGKSRSYHDTTVGEIVKKVAGKHKLSAQVHPEIAKIKIGHIDQSGESDVNFLTRLSKRVGATFNIKDGKALFNKAGSGDLPGGGKAPTFRLVEADVTDWTATGSERGSYQSATASFQNVETGEREWIAEGEGKPRLRDRRLYKTRDEAQAAVKAQFDALKRGKVSVSITMPGRPEIFAGSQVDLAFEDEDVDGLYNVKTATHTLDGSGLKTVLSVESVGSEKDDEKKDSEKADE